MRQLSFLIFFMLLIFESQAQVSVTNVARRVNAVIEKAEELDMQVLFYQVDNISQGQTSSQTYQLSGSSSYSIVAIGDESRISDIDLYVYDEYGNLIGKDPDSKNIAIVDLTVSRSQKYRFKVDPYSMLKNDGFYGILVLRK